MTAVDESEATRKAVVNRLRRAQGQSAAVLAAVESDADCRKVITQLSAVTSALDKAGFMIIAHAMRDCAVDPDAEDGRPTVAELEKLFLSLA